MSIHQEPAVPTIEAFADALLRVARPPAEPLSDGEQVVSITAIAPGDWPDGQRIEVRLRRAGTGPNVLLVHGWEGKPSDLNSIAQALVGAGFTVWTPELPGHGSSGGKMLSIPLAAQVLLATQTAAGPFALAVGHSMGAACIVHAMEQGLLAQRVVLIATPTHYGQFVRAMAHQAGIKGLSADALIERLHTVIGEHPDWIDMRRQATARTEPALFIHSSDDRVTSFEAARAAATLWPGAEWSPVEGLGHKRLLNDAKVVQRVLSFGIQAAKAVGRGV